MTRRNEDASQAVWAFIDAGDYSGAAIAGIATKAMAIVIAKGKVGAPFARAQKRDILAENPARNGGELKSGKSGKIVPRAKSQRGVTPPENEAQVDHKSLALAVVQNDPSNAQVLSRRENREKWDKME